ncbi:hypothetical protein FHS18_000487 [Paenibacillus phyllosphaerae]|uniref:Permease n=1 Tax=Paenibacillus phyllosphaerae TaxID=274593 RepID=A0A7W5ATU3_9BACL|nr:permease [Paenibacillus phyllosphaerae]MBB3108459.1 hypothetical protein [Paenibacillus phyllosphaerae]
MSVVYRFGTPLLGVGCLLMLMLILADHGLIEQLSSIDSEVLQSFKLLFIGIILETFPFILLGVIVSAILQVFVSDERLARITPKGPVGGVLFGSLLGLLLPLCECGMIPVVRRLIRKGMPAYIGMIFIFAGPIINPVVFTSTFTAFRGQPSMAYSRLGLALAVCVIFGVVLYKFMKRDPLKHDAYSLAKANNGIAGIYEHDHSAGNKGLRGRITATLAHASDELFDIGKYVILGAFLTALVQTTIDREILLSLGSGAIQGSAFMMGFAFLLSLCSTSDAFVASSFNGVFPPGALLAFLVFGPMVDLKSTLMLLATFRTKVVAAMIALLFVLVLAGSIITGHLLM